MPTARLLSGPPIAENILSELKDSIQRHNPRLVIVQVGNDPASSSYVKQKMKSCDAVGLRHHHLHLPQTTTREELLAMIQSLNEDDDVTGFIVQLPLPEHLKKEENDVIEAIAPAKDIDGFTATNIGRMFLGLSGSPTPATPTGVLAILDHAAIDVVGLHAVVVGRSNIVGKPLATMLMSRGATVTVCHSKTKDLASITRQADLLCLAVGKPRMITKDMVKPGAVVIDIGVSRVDGKLVGDADFDAIKEHASAITPVPGGVGPLTVACLIQNCVRQAERKAQKA